MIIRARFHAYAGEDSKKVADILDDAEFLMALCVKGKDDEFREYLSMVSMEHPEFKGLIEEYDREPVAA